jgi:transposase
MEWRWNQAPEGKERKRQAADRNKATSPKPSKEILYELHCVARLNPRQIGDRFDVQAPTVRKWLHQYSIALLPNEAPVQGRQGIKPPPPETLVAMYEGESLPTTAIAERFNVSGTTVIKWLRDYGIRLRPNGVGLAARGITPPTEAELRQMIHAERLTYGEIAAKYGVDQSAIMHWLNKLGIERPPTWYEAHDKPEMVSEMYAAYEAGASIDDIGQHYGGVTRTMVVRLFKAHGIQLRPDGWQGGKRFVCQDGHRVRSTYECRVDDWLNENGVNHIYEPPLPFSPVHKADFFANGWYIEVWGVTKNQEYEERKQRKRDLYAANHAPLIEIPFYAFDKANRELWKRRLHQCLISPN